MNVTVQTTFARGKSQFSDGIQHLDTSVLLFFIHKLYIYMQTQWEYLVLKDVGQAQDPPDSWLQAAIPFSNGFWVKLVCVCSVPSTGIKCVTCLYIGMETVKQILLINKTLLEATERFQLPEEVL